MATGVALLFSAAGVAALAPLPHGDAARLTDICMPLLPGRPTASSECAVERLEFGNTNRLFSLARARGDRFLVREVRASDRPAHPTPLHPCAHSIDLRLVRPSLACTRRLHSIGDLRTASTRCCLAAALRRN